jgi:hypothetical protein
LGSSSHRPCTSTHFATSSNPTASTTVDRYQTETCKTLVFWRLARREKRLDLGSATRNATPQAPCTELHGRYRRSKELRRNAKNPGKTRVFERRGQEPNNPQIPWEKRGFQNEATQNPTRAAKHFVRCLLHARAAALSWTLNRLLAHPHITGSFTR